MGPGNTLNYKAKSSSQEEASIDDILQELNIKSLKEVCALRSVPGVDLNIKRRKTLLKEIKADTRNWSTRQKEELTKIYIREKRTTVNYTTHIFRSDDIQQMGTKEIANLLEDKLVRIEGDRLIQGFENVEGKGEEIRCIFKGNVERLIPIAGKLLKEKQFISIPIIASKDEGQILFKGNNSRQIKTAREFFGRTLSLKKLYYSIPQGIKEEGANHKDYNGRARDFIAKLGVEEVNGVLLKVGGKIGINKVSYGGKGDILQAKEIKDKIRNGALMTGINGYIRHNDLLIDFRIRWGYYCLITVKSPNLSPEIIDSLLKKISSVYKEKMTR